MTDPKSDIARWQNALPFWLSLLLLPFVGLGAIYGGWWVFVLPVMTWWLFSLIDAFVGLNEGNPDPNTPDDQLYWYQLVTLIWPPVQFLALFGSLWLVVHVFPMTGAELFFFFFGIGVMTGTIGINYSHELMHQTSRLERWWADILLAMVLYSHFRSEHLLVHHRYVGTPRDPVTARYNEGFWRFFPRVLWQCFRSALGAERVQLARRELGFMHPINPFWRYWALQLGFLALAYLIAGWLGIVLFAWQALVAIFQLELVNYVEHYGLTRKHLGGGKYEHVQPRHSWNAAQKASNWLLINLQRHSDHHYKPARRFPLLQTYDDNEAPQLPRGYPLMTVAAVIPPLWRRVMNPRVRAWRKRYYPEISDWEPYKHAKNPMPR